MNGIGLELAYICRDTKSLFNELSLLSFLKRSATWIYSFYKKDIIPGRRRNPPAQIVYSQKHPDKRSLQKCKLVK
jgi:hypothetical protein